MTPAVAQAVAWIALTGGMPRGIRISTFAAANQQVDFAPERYRDERRFYFLRPDTDPAYQRAPLWLRHVELTAQGFTLVGEEPKKLRRYHISERWALTYTRGDHEVAYVSSDGCAKLFSNGRCTRFSVRPHAAQGE